jgi:histone acetyltransferase
MDIKEGANNDKDVVSSFIGDALAPGQDRTCEAPGSAGVPGTEPDSNKPSQGRRVQPTKVASLSPAPAAASTAQRSPTNPAHQHQGYVARERMHMERENTGEVTALYVVNDGQAESGKTLISLKNIFSKCLPNMPKTYISRLVFDRRHRSVVIKRKNGKVLAGITYRPFHDRKFAEIAFCAVAQTLQVSGFGTRLMNWTKHFAREKDDVEYFLTYADNAAVGYFAKQGFTKFQTMSKDRWFGYIKDYDGGTLMECYIHPTLPYNSLPNMIESQKKFLEGDVQSITGKLSEARIVYPGLEGYFSSDVDGRRVIPTMGDIPGVVESGWTKEVHDASHPSFKIRLNGKFVNPTAGNLKQFELFLLDTLAKDPLAWPFLEPVNVKDVPDYLQTIKDPMDLGTIRKRLLLGSFYITIDIFVADVLRIFKNAKLFNGPDSDYTKAAQKLTTLFNNTLQDNIAYNIDDSNDIK